ncbi:MAG TPA: ABC transporter substrate-binding protein [Chloroflexota bacterium]|jgi:ABC-type nitrate/sulfonate/bicarbonate transport system substrate-binding protein
MKRGRPAVARASGLPLLLALLAPLLLAGTPAPQTKALTSLRVAPAADSATDVGRLRGFFAAEGLDVATVVTTSSTDQMRGVGDGTYDVVFTAFDNVLAWSGREGAELVAVLRSNDGPLLPLYVRPEITDWGDLRGKPLAADAVDTAFALVLRRILLAHDLDLDRDDYTLVAVGNPTLRLQAMERGEAYAAILNPPTDARAEAAGMVRFGDHREVLPRYPGNVAAVSRAWATQHRAALIGFLRGWLATARWIHANRDAAAELLAADQGISRDAAATRLAAVPQDGALDPEGLASVLALRTQFGLTPPLGPDVSRYYTAEYLQATAAR